MKKIAFKTKQNTTLTLSFLLIFSLTIFSCDSEKEQITKLKDDFSNARKGMSYDVIATFEKDVMASNFDLEIKNWKVALDKQNFVEVERHQESIDKTLKTFYENYKEENVEEYVKILHEIEVRALGTHDGNPCTRNKDSTIYLDACTFWGKVRFYMNFSCSGLPKDKPSQQEVYLNCLQSTICEICK